MPLPPVNNSLLLLEAAFFAASRHGAQLRKDKHGSPYINHPLAVACLLAELAPEAPTELLQAALLHDTLEDTSTTAEELQERFGSRVRHWVEEMTDDPTLSKEDRKQHQIDHAPQLSREARLIKLADKICNAGDMTPDDPEGWTLERKLAYLDWASQVVARLRGTDAGLERRFAETVARQRGLLNSGARQPAGDG